MNLTNAISPEELLVQNLDKAPFALIVWTPEFEVVSWSQLAEELFGWTEAEVKGKHFSEFDIIYSDDWPLIEGEVGRMVKGEIERFTSSNRNYRKDRNIINCYWHCFVVRNESGVVNHILTLVQDVSEQMQKDLALRRANQRFALITNATSDGIWEWNVLENKVWANETYCKTYGYDPAVYFNFYEEWLTRLHPADVDHFLEVITEAREKKQKSWSGEFRFRLANGSYGYILQKVHFIYNAEGALIKAVGNDINITSLRMTEAALRVSEEKFSKAFRSSPVPVNIINRNNGLITDVNEAFCKLTGFDKDELITKKFNELNILEEKFIEALKECLEANSIVSNYQVKMRRKNGVDIHALISCEEMQIDGVPYVMTILQDITEQVKAEAALKLNEQQLKLVYNTINDILFLLEVEDAQTFRFITVNNAFLAATGLSYHAAAGHLVQEVVPEPSLKEVLSKFRLAIDTKNTVQWVQQSPYNQSSKFNVINVTPVYNQEGICIRIVGTAHDITAQKQAADELSRSYQEIKLLAAHLQAVREEERGNMAREVHDELGQLLTALKMEVSWLKKIDALNAKQVGQRVNSVNNLLDEAIKTVRNISAKLRPSILDDLGLADALAWQSREFEKRYGISTGFSTNVEETKLSKELSTAFFRIYQEALTNVARHAHASRVVASFVRSGENFILKIADNGIGFELQRIDAQKTLGLVGIKERIAAVKGIFNLQTAPGEGTILTITAPAPN